MRPSLEPVPDPVTPGPWEVLPPADPDAPGDSYGWMYKVVHAATRQPVAYCRSAADAAAIATLPELYETLLTSLRTLDPFGTLDP